MVLCGVFVLYVGYVKFSYSEITITKDDFVGYPAVFLNLRTAEVISLSPAVWEDGYEIDADLWIEPGDPEVSGLSQKSSEAGIHKGADVFVAGIEKFFEDVPYDLVESELLWLPSLSRRELQPGRMFFVKASDESLFKVEIRHLDSRAGEMRLRYKSVD